MEYKPLTFPLSPEVAADLCNPGSPPEGHVRVVVTETDNTPKLVTVIDSHTAATIRDCYAEDEDPVRYCIGIVLKDVVDMLPEWSP